MWRSLLLIGLASGTAVAAAPAQPAKQPVSASRQVDAGIVIADLRRILRSNYVLPEVRPKLDAALESGLKSGRYKVADPAELVNRINADLNAVAHDKHLGIKFDPAQQAELASRPPGSGADDAPPTADDVRRASSINHGIQSLRMLPGNVRYMEYNGFVWAGPKTAEALDNAMRFLRDGDAIVIDLRQNGGGSPEAVQYLVSHFLEADRKIVTFYMRGDPAEPLSTISSLPAGRMVGKPLYVLTSSHSASAAEEFVGHVAGFKIGELIGETTAGAGYRNEFFPVAGGYVISVSVGRAVLASTGKDWEGIGIAPTTKTDPDKALDLAQVHAWRAIAAKASVDQRRILEANAALLDAKLNPVPTALPLTSYAGTYGERSLTVAGDRLEWRRGDGPKLQLVAVGPNEFSFDQDPLSRVVFAVAGSNVTGFKMVRADGSTVEARRQP